MTDNDETAAIYDGRVDEIDVELGTTAEHGAAPVKRQYHLLTPEEVTRITSLPHVEQREAVLAIAMAHPGKSLQLEVTSDDADWGRHWSHALMRHCHRAFIHRSDGRSQVVKDADIPAGMMATSALMGLP